MAIDTLLFSQLLQSELQLTSDLQQVLELEMAALRANDLGPISELQPQKAELLQQIKQQAAIRLDWLTEHNLPHSVDCLQRPELADQAEIQTLWQQLHDSYSNNQQLSERLSELVLTARKRTIDRLNILRGRKNDPHLYNSSGKASGLNKGFGYTRA